MKLRHSIAVGADWAVVRLESGEYLCVDTSTFEALGYILGWQHEADVIRIFRTFLTQRSVVLDIGANFGLYTALSASIVKNHGRLFAFEGNPRVFESLQRTIVANNLYLNPNIVAANVLVSSECGRGLLHYSANLPSGGTMSDVQLSGGKQHAIEVDMTTIDDFLPSDLAVDLVKIDVEGYEPLVLRGMERTIARSPNIRIVTEFADSLLAHTVNPADFADYIRSLGFAICRVLPNFKISLVPAGQTLSGFNYCLLTRTPEEDIRSVEQRRKFLPIRFKRWLDRHPVRWGRWRRIWARW
ncbi:MAG TPA: FkbM family methyltransferase [Stellaceae bacterium]|nr:FkbM family methyltransferase [Stellaceae bacterium]